MMTEDSDSAYLTMGSLSPLERHEDFKTNCWIEVSDSISYRKIGHAFRSNSRRLTAEKNAEVAAAEEAARRGKKYEEVLAETTNERPKSPNPPHISSVPVMLPPTEKGTQMHFYSSGDVLLQLEARRRSLLNQERRLFDIQMEASLKARYARAAMVSSSVPELFDPLGNLAVSELSLTIPPRYHGSLFARTSFAGELSSIQSPLTSLPVRTVDAGFLGGRLPSIGIQSDPILHREIMLRSAAQRDPRLADVLMEQLKRPATMNCAIRKNSLSENQRLLEGGVAPLIRREKKT